MFGIYIGAVKFESFRVTVTPIGETNSEPKKERKESFEYENHFFLLLGKYNEHFCSQKFDDFL